MTGNTGKEYILFNFFNDFLRVGQKLYNFEKKDYFQKIAATQLSVIGQLTSSCIISDLVCKEQPNTVFNKGNNNDKYVFDLRNMFVNQEIRIFFSKNKRIRLTEKPSPVPSAIEFDLK